MCASLEMIVKQILEKMLNDNDISCCRNLMKHQFTQACMCFLENSIWFGILVWTHFRLQWFLHDWIEKFIQTHWICMWNISPKPMKILWNSWLFDFAYISFFLLQFYSAIFRFTLLKTMIEFRKCLTIRWFFRAASHIIQIIWSRSPNYMIFVDFIFFFNQN